MELVTDENGEALDRERGVDPLQDVEKKLIRDVVGAFDDEAPQPFAQREEPGVVLVGDRVGHVADRCRDGGHGVRHRPAGAQTSGVGPDGRPQLEHRTHDGGIDRSVGTNDEPREQLGAGRASEVAHTGRLAVADVDETE